MSFYRFVRLFSALRFSLKIKSFTKQKNVLPIRYSSWLFNFKFLKFIFDIILSLFRVFRFPRAWFLRYIIQFAPRQLCITTIFWLWISQGELQTISTLRVYDPLALDSFIQSGYFPADFWCPIISAKNDFYICCVFFFHWWPHCLLIFWILKWRIVEHSSACGKRYSKI